MKWRREKERERERERESAGKRYEVRGNEDEMREGSARAGRTEKIRRIRARVFVRYTSIYIKNRSTATIRDLFSK